MSLVARSYYAASGAEFAHAVPDAILGALVRQHSFDVDQQQRNAWHREVSHLQEISISFPNAYLFLEFTIPRMGKRADAIILLHGHVFVIEYKVGATSYERSSIDQVVDYALDLKNFHEGSHSRSIVPILVATEAPPQQLPVRLDSDGVAEPVLANREGLLKAIEEVDKILIPEPIDALEWANSAYKPTPTIIEAAQALYRGHNVKEISRSEAGAENLSKTSDYIMNVADEARRRNQKSICFVTGVPGSGKTLAGLNIATQMKSSLQEDAVFLSGNGPLVEVLREALSNDEIQRKNVGAKKDALRSASKFIQNIHHFRDEYVISQKAPVERIVVFDEAQRAWNKEQTSRFMRDKRGRVDFNMSEPEFLLSIMDRHEGWCVVICLIGGGQEINTGEAGLLEWLTALERGYGSWRVYLSDRIGDSNYLGDQGSLQSAIECLAAQSSPFLHLSTCLRSFRAEALSSFIGAIILGESTSASKVYSNLSNYPLVVTRDIEKARDWLRRQARGNERIGLVASSNAMRLKPSGIHVKAKIDPPIWFLADKIDVRSSFALEDVATEFDIQGLELDWVGMCWDANFRRENNSWGCYSFRGSRWEHVKEPIRMAYLANSYRVLLTRARQGMVIYIPNGSNIDHSRNSKFYDPTYKFLRDCGINELS